MAKNATNLTNPSNNIEDNGNFYSFNSIFLIHLSQRSIDRLIDGVDRFVGENDSQLHPSHKSNNNLTPTPTRS